MSKKGVINLYELLPVLYRLEDAKQGYPLRALLDLISEQADILKHGIDNLWDDFFIETCADWVIPYIGDLVGNNPIHEVVKTRRADVAKTIYYRRRKGTLPMLEELARDVTGWGAHAVAFFELLSWTQNLNHQRYHMAPNPESRYPNSVERVGTINLRNIDALDRLDSPFDSSSHTADVRTISQYEGWHNIRNIGFYLWRLKSYPLTGIIPRKSTNHQYGYHFSPLGNPAPLFIKPDPESNESGLADEIHVPSPIRQMAFYFDLKEYERKYKDVAEKDRPPNSKYYGPKRSLVIRKDDKIIPPIDVMCKNLKNWDCPPSGKVAVDVHRGRLTFAQNEEPDKIEVDYSYGFSDDIGGGQYERHSVSAGSDINTWQISVKKGNAIETLEDALIKWDDDGKPSGTIKISDNGIYEGQVKIELPANVVCRLVIKADDGFRPVLRTKPMAYNLMITGKHPDSEVHLNGLLFEGHGINIKGKLGLLKITHCTLVPGDHLTEEGNYAKSNNISLFAGSPGDNLHIIIAFSITGAIRLPPQMKELTITDSIVDANGNVALAAKSGLNIEYGPPASIERTTVFGEVFATELKLVSEAIFTGSVKAQRCQSGCIRYSYLPDVSSQTPRRYRCQPDLALEAKAKELNKDSVDKLSDPEKELVRSGLSPAFTSVIYGNPGYAQLSSMCAEQIRTGAEDGSEMGVFSKLKQPQRQTNLRIRLEEYLPFGLKAGQIYVT